MNREDAKVAKGLGYICNSVTQYFGTDFTDDTVFVVVIEIQAPEFLLRTILRKGEDFAFDFDAFAEVDQEAYLYAGSFQIVDELGFVRGMKFFDGREFEDYFALHNYVCNIFANKLGIVIDLDLFFFFSLEAGL